VTSSVSPYLQRPVRKLEDVKPEQAPSRTPSVADDSASVGAPHPAPESPPSD
jgi:hypothetical protein